MTFPGADDWTRERAASRLPTVASQCEGAGLADAGAASSGTRREQQAATIASTATTRPGERGRAIGHSRSTGCGREAEFRTDLSDAGARGKDARRPGKRAVSPTALAGCGRG